MLYTVLGAICGSIGTYVICKITNVSFVESFGSSNGSICILFGTIIGGAVGFGYGSRMLATGQHPYNSLWW